MARGQAPPIESIAQVVERLAVLLGAGVAPASAWHHLAADDPAELDQHGAGSDPMGAAGPVARAVAARGAFGSGVADAIEEAAGAAPSSVRGRVARRADPGHRELSHAWRALAAAWFVAAESGAPLAVCLRSLAGIFRALGDIHREVQVALTAPAATARMVMLLPLVSVLFGVGLGFDVLQVLFVSWPGRICLGLGALLMLAANRWNRRLVAAAAPRNVTPGLLVDLMAIAMAGGGSLDRARTLVNEASDRFGLAADAPGEQAAIDRVLSLARRAGVPAAELLRSEADQLRRTARSDGQRSAAALAVRLMLPLAVCVLPAFMVIGVVPLLIAVLSSTVGSF